jgi:hypothetical protein
MKDERLDSRRHDRVRHASRVGPASLSEERDHTGEHATDEAQPDAAIHPSILPLGNAGQDVDVFCRVLN